MDNNSIWEKFERCSNLMVAYREKFNKNFPGYLLFNPMEEICEMIEEALENNKEIEEWNK